MVRAKFVVQQVTRSKNYQPSGVDLFTVKLLPVYGTSDENKRFYDATPSGAIELGVLRQEVAERFAIGKEFYVDFTPAGE